MRSSSSNHPFPSATVGGPPISTESIPDGDPRADQKRRSLWQACAAAHVADELRGQDTMVLDLGRVTPIVDYFVITTGINRRQMHAIAEEVDRVLSQEGSARMGIEGFQASTWILQDYGDVVLHVLTEEARGLYDLEHLWADAPRIDWRQEQSTESRPAPSSAEFSVPE